MKRVESYLVRDQQPATGSKLARYTLDKTENNSEAADSLKSVSGTNSVSEASDQQEDALRVRALYSMMS